MGVRRTAEEAVAILRRKLLDRSPLLPCSFSASSSRQGQDWKTAKVHGDSNDAGKVVKLKSAKNDYPRY
jgi:hypothetical protein